jgi:hypothetical protein
VNGNYVRVERPTSQVTSQVTCEVLPNPFLSGAFLRIYSPTTLGNTSLAIYNLYGQEVRRMDNGSTSMVYIDGVGLSSGLYIYRLSESQGRLLFTGKFIVR